MGSAILDDVSKHLYPNLPLQYGSAYCIIYFAGCVALQKPHPFSVVVLDKEYTQLSHKGHNKNVGGLN